MQDSLNNRETNNNGNDGTVVCPNRSCGKEISIKFDNCPFCNTPLIKTKRTAEEIINEHKELLIKEQKEEILKEAVRKRYNVDGDISDEQYRQLIEIYKHEVGEITMNEKKNVKENNNHGKKLPTGNDGTVICPNHSCGKEISIKFDNCPFCNTPLIKTKRTAEEIINEHKRKEELINKQKEEIFKDVVRRRYNIDGDISEEQYGQLKEIYMKEYGNKDDTHEHEHSSGQRNGYVGWIIGIVAALIIFLIIFFASGGGHSNTYNEYMSRIKAREAAINSATSLFDMDNLNERILRLGALDDLTDGDEKRAVRMAHNEVWNLFEKKCQQLSVGKYRLTSKYGNTYIIELTHELYKDKNDTYIARIYKNNSLFEAGRWWKDGTTSVIDNDNYMDKIEIRIWPERESKVFEWSGKLEKNPKYDWRDRDEGIVEKIK